MSRSTVSPRLMDWNSSVDRTERQEAGRNCGNIGAHRNMGPAHRITGKRRGQLAGAYPGGFLSRGGHNLDHPIEAALALDGDRTVQARLSSAVVEGVLFHYITAPR